MIFFIYFFLRRGVGGFILGSKMVSIVMFFFFEKCFNCNVMK